MLNDTVQSYLGREAEWAALCAIDGIEATETPPDPTDASDMINDVWEFVVANLCMVIARTHFSPY